MSDHLDRLAAGLAERYRIERELGAGGMAMVYLAHDVRHDRKVALKILRPELAAVIGGDRFLGEIRTTANLQHPHILPLHDSGEVDGTVFYVMPFIEGESLRDRLNREKQLPVEDAVRIASEVAAALDYAHRHGVVHRDIKPENILLHDGSALVADFGIALAVSRSDGGSRMTETGMSLGTPHYMAPEQAMGEREITPRADIYALGCVLYEMLTAEPPFNGATAQAIVARVMTEQPRSLTLQRHTIPPHVEAAVQTALEKLPADRFATAAQFAEALARPGAHVRPGAVSAAAPQVSRASRLVVPLALVTVAALAVAAWALFRPRPEAPVERYGLSLPQSQAPIVEAAFALSPDGSNLVYVGPGEGTTTQLWIKPRDAATAHPITGTTGAANFTISPDGEWIGMVQAGQVRKLPITGAAAITLADSASSRPGLAWLDDGSIVFIAFGGRALKRVPAAGGAVDVVWGSDSTNYLAFPSPLPGGRGVLFVTCFIPCVTRDLWVLDLKAGDTRLLQPGVAMGVYLSTGHVIYARPDGAMFALPFDLKGLKATGAAVPVQDSIVVLDQSRPQMSVSREGSLAIRRGASASTLQRYRMVWVDRRGLQTEVDSNWTFRHITTGQNAGWSLSPDGTRLAIGLATEAGDNIWVKQLPDGPVNRVTFDSAAEYRPRWMPDGRSVLFSSNRPGLDGLYRRRADGTGADELVLRGNIHEGMVSRDGQWVLARAGGQVSQAGGRNIGAMRLGTDTALTPLVATSFDESEIALSPDGSWLAYVSDETGTPEVFIRPFPGVEAAKYQVSSGGAQSPLWAPNGRELFFVSLNRQMMVVPVTSTGTVLQLGERKVLFRLADELYLTEREFYTPFDVSADGQRFIMARRLRSEALLETPIVITRNWFTELRRQGGR